jgi:serine/threonine protein kinase/Tol biopolymer transport system component
MTLERGTLLNKRYRIVEILGQGGMGAVYRAVDENLAVDVAVKENLFTTEEYARQFRREALILANLRHPNLPRVTDHFIIDNQGQYLVMDYIEGEDLRQRMDRLGVVPEEEVIVIGAAMCDALSYLDSRNPPIIHRDIKPGNIKITPQGQIFLVDFGLAKIVQGTQATTTGARAMTPGYSPPEQYGTARTDHRSDLFSLGATLYAALTGVIPEDALARAMEQVELTNIRKRNPKISRRLAAVLEKALEVRPDDRYQDAEEFKQALLSARNNTKRYVGEYLVEPPPEDYLSVNRVSDAGSPSGTGNGRSPVLEGRSPLPLPISTPIDEPLPTSWSRPRPRTRRRRTNFFPLVLIALLLAVIGAGAVYIYNPSLPNQAIFWLGVFPTPTQTLDINELSTQAVLNMALQSRTTTPQPSPQPTEPPTASPTLNPTATGTPTTIPASSVVPMIVMPTPTLTSTPMGGGAGQIAFASDRSGMNQIYLMNTDGSNVVRITNMPEGACQPDWSPDGMRLVFISPCSRNLDRYSGSGLFIINVDGTGLVPLPTVPGGDFDPSWSPDGKMIAFTSLRNSGRERIYVINLEDNTVKRLSEQYSRDKQPEWSPDGTKIAFVSQRDGPSQIWTMYPDGTEQKPFSQSGSKIDTHPVWYPDGTGILFTQAEVAGGVTSLVAASYSDQEYTEYRFDFGPIPIREARYSPDGLWIVFESWPQGSNHEIYIATASGANRTPITNYARWDFDPIWRPLVKTP